MQNRKVVIIDEDKKLLRELKEVLTVSRYMPIIVDNPLLAIDIVLYTKPRVILLELRMLHQNGFVIAKGINQACGINRMPIIGMSESFKDDSRYLLDLCGIKRFLKKPFNPLDVICALEDLPEETDQWDGRRADEESAVTLNALTAI